MRVFDLHCDTIGECFNQGKSLYKNDLHLDLERCSKYDSYTQVFAVWIPDELRGERALTYFNKVSDFLYKEIEQNNSIISLLGSECNTPVKAVLSLEGGSGCGGSIEGLYHLYKKGVRLITLTWNANNEIGAGAFSRGGLTSFGRDFIKVCDELGVIIDVSHLNRETFKDVLECTKNPVVASHSNANIVDNYYARHRNLDVYQIDAIKERGGLIGLNYCTDFIQTDKIGAQALAQQFDFFLSHGCENVISLGSDYDGCEMHTDFCGVEKAEALYKSIILSGFSQNETDKLFYKNAQGFFTRKKTCNV